MVELQKRCYRGSTLQSISHKESSAIVIDNFIDCVTVRLELNSGSLDLDRSLTFTTRPATSLNVIISIIVTLFLYEMTAYGHLTMAISLIIFISVLYNYIYYNEMILSYT